VASACHRDIDSLKCARAWALISPGLATGQTYQQFVAGCACTGNERPTKLGLSGHQVSFSLTVVNDCPSRPSYYTRTDIVRSGKIVAAYIARTG